jgi:membrane protein YdbS with pleckstrin-like domain
MCHPKVVSGRAAGERTNAGRMDAVTTLTLRAPAHHVSPRAKLYWAVRASFGWLVFAAIQVMVWLSRDDPDAWHPILMAVTVVLALTHLIVMPQWRFRIHRWEATETAVYTQTGWFTQERRIAPVARIQTVDTQRGPFEQLFKLSNVTITTASAAGPLKIHGLQREIADALVEDLTVRTHAAGGDGT